MPSTEPNSLNRVGPQTNHIRVHYPYFTDEKTEAQATSKICLKCMEPLGGRVGN